MIYIISGVEPYLINEELSKILSKYTDFSSVSKYDNPKKDELQEILDSCYEQGLFSNSSAVIVKDPSFLIKKEENELISKIVEYCRNPLYETDLVFYTLENKFNERLSIYKEISSNAQVIKFNQYKKNDFISYCKSVVKETKLKINKYGLDTLINACNNSISLFHENLNVLCLYPDEIDDKVVKALITYSDEEDVFNLINAIINKKHSLALTYARKITKNSDNLFGLIALLSSQLRFLYNVSYYRNNNKNNSEIMDLLNISSPYRLDKAFETLRNVSEKEILSLLDNLADLDYKLKTNNSLNEITEFELMILKVGN